MAGKGGYEAPHNPAPASGPGRLARRTDGGPAQKQQTFTGLPYGEGGQLTAQQAGAPMAQADPIATNPIVAGLHEPSTRPNEPVTTGIDRGPGAGSEVLSPTFDTAASSYGALTTILSQLSGSDTTGTIAALAMEARARGL